VVQYPPVITEFLEASCTPVDRASGLSAMRLCQFRIGIIPETAKNRSFSAYRNGIYIACGHDDSAHPATSRLAAWRSRSGCAQSFKAVVINSMQIRLLRLGGNLGREIERFILTYNRDNGQN
jgi:hypothetical protein